MLCRTVANRMPFLFFRFGAVFFVEKMHGIFFQRLELENLAFEFVIPVWQVLVSVTIVIVRRLSLPSGF